MWDENAHYTQMVIALVNKRMKMDELNETMARLPEGSSFIYIHPDERDD